MRVYVVVTVHSGCIHEVKGFKDAGEAETELARVRKELDIIPGKESESENNAQLVELEPLPILVSKDRVSWAISTLSGTLEKILFEFAEAERANISVKLGTYTLGYLGLSYGIKYG